MKRRLVRLISRMLVFFYAFSCVNLHAQTADLSSVPLVTSSTSSVLPNLVFILDDSGSMDWDYMPDWANDGSPSVTVFRNNEYNGVAYSAANTYSPPVYYNADGTLNTTTYPSQTSSATSTFTKVKNDGYGIQSTSTSDLTSGTNAAYFFTFVAGEYCTTSNLRTCVTQTAPSVTYPFPAKLRWCTPTKSSDTSPTAASTMTDCQSVRIEEGSKLYTVARVPGGTNSTATITVTSPNNMVVNGVTVNGAQIMSGNTGTASGSASTIAAAIVTKINACTSARTGNCDIEGFSASNSSGVVTITGGAGGFSPAVQSTQTSGTTPVTAFSGGLPGSNIRTDIVSGVNYPFPGTTTKASTRSDCAATTCTYTEEMTNYANWYAYYRTRMQMMKTSTGSAFANISTKYRVGFDTINGNTSSFLNVSTFNAAQKKAWYDKLYAAKPDNSTPLRQALATIGRLYAGKLNDTTHHGSTVVDPVQYSCQQNFTILSTDGYWNGSAGFKIDGNAFGSLNPDGPEIRPFNDGATQVVNTVTPRVTTVRRQTVQGVEVTSNWTRTVVTVGASCTTAATTVEPSDCVNDGGHYRDNNPNSSDIRKWCVMPNRDNGSECSSNNFISGTTIYACRGSGNSSNYPNENTPALSFNQACRTDSGGQRWCIYRGNTTSGTTGCVRITGGFEGSGPTNIDANYMFVCKPPTTPGATGNTVTSASQTSQVIQTGTQTTVEDVATTTNSTVVTTNGVAAPAVDSSGGTITTTVSSTAVLTPASNAPVTWTTASTSSTCSAVSASVAPHGQALGSTSTKNTGGTATPTTLSTTGPVYGTPTTSSTSTGGVLDTLADVAQYYYATDLRDASFSNCTGVPIPPATTGLNVCGATTTGDLIQRMVTFTLGLGASGQMQYSPTYSTATSGDYFNVKNGTLADPTNNICIWQTGGACNWPAPESNSQKTIDDLWHAAVNGRGTFFSATNPATLASGLQSALAGVQSQLGSSAAATTSNPNVTSGDNFVFSTTFNTGVIDKGGWDGQLVRNQLDLVTGVVNSVNDWEARAQLDTKATAGTRTIYMFDSTVAGKLKTFNWTNLSTTQKTFFNEATLSATTTGLSQFCSAGATCLAAADKTLASGNSLVEYLSGVRTNEGISTDVSKYYRVRSYVLGDIVNAEAVYVKTPLLTYADSGFSDYVADQASRQGMVYAAGNDGMLHAFNATTGVESWAFVPTPVLPSLYKLADKNYAALHQFYVDGTPVAGEVKFASITSGAEKDKWRSILVGGMNNGARGYYALDVTNPAAPKALWEYTDTNLGFTYGNPVITKLKDGTWVVIFSSGYNNVSGGDGVGRLYILNAETGALIRTISTGVGNTTTPSGLSKINAWVDAANTDNTVLRVYGGDLLGNVWRFDVNGDIGASGYDAHRLVTLYGNVAGTITQSVTSRPELGEASGNPVILVGTGRFLGATDLSDTSTQSFYAIKDKLDTVSFTNPKASGSGFIKQQMGETTCPAGTPSSVCTTGQTVRVSINEATVNFSSDNGWYLDFIGTGERANTDPTLALGTLGFTTNLPNTSACSAGGTSFRYFLDYTKGTPVSTARSSSTGTGVVGVSFGNALATRGVFVRLPNNTIVQLTRLSTGTTVTSNVPIGSGGSSTKRVSWRELISE
ncbi:MAG: PilC/PilY family type IV pilus protein [Burkholderiales bacterium]